MASSKSKVDEDPTWKYCVLVDSKKKKVQCSFCGKIVSSGVFRQKQHLAGVAGDVAACTQVPLEVRKEMRDLLNDRKRQKDITKRRSEKVREELASIGEDREDTEDEESETDPDNDDDEEERYIRKAKKMSRRSLIEDECRRRGEGSSAPGRTTHRTGSMRFEEQHPQEIPRSSSVRIGRDSERPSKMQAFFHKKQGSKQPRIETAIKGIKNAKQTIGKAISRWFYYSHIPFNTADNNHFKNMVSAIQESGPGVAPPTAYEIGNTYLQHEFDTTMDFIKTLYPFWDEMGCTLMCDGWTTNTRRQIINFLVYNPHGTVFLKSVDATEHVKTAKYIFKLMDQMVEEIGESRVVQVVTDNGANFKAAGQMLMDKRKQLFWTPCAAHCIDLLLEDIASEDEMVATFRQARSITNFIYNHGWALNLMRKETGNRELTRPGITRFATHFISIQSIYMHCDALRRMCCSKEWGDNVHKMKKKDKEVANKIYRTVIDEDFWKGAAFCIHIFEPLVKVLRLVDLDEQAQMGFLYEAMDRAKEQIRANLGRSGSYMRWWNIIDARWDKTLHKDLHAAGYFLNPRFRYKDNSSSIVDVDVLRGLRKALDRLELDLYKRISIDKEIDSFRRREGFFSTAKAVKAVTMMTPSQWWSIYGHEEAPNLTPIAVRILSQTTSSSHCERNWTTFSLIHTKTRNRLTTQKLEKLVFIHYNMRLRERQLERDAEKLIDLDQVFHDDDPLVEWLREKEQPALDGRANPWDDEIGSTQGIEAQSHYQQRNQEQERRTSRTPSQRRSRHSLSSRDSHSRSPSDDGRSPTRSGGGGSGPGGSGGYGGDDYGTHTSEGVGGSTSITRYPTDDPSHSQPYWRTGDDTMGTEYGGTYFPSTYDPTRDVGQHKAVEAVEPSYIGPRPRVRGGHVGGLSGGSSPAAYGHPAFAHYYGYVDSTYGGGSYIGDSSSSYGSYAYGGPGLIGEGGSTIDTSSSSGPPGTQQLGPLDSMMTSFFGETEQLYHYYHHRDDEDDEDEHRSLRDPPRNSTWY